MNDKRSNWYIERILFLVGGSVSLAGVSIGYLVGQWGYVLNLLVGLNMFLFATTGFCPMALVLKRFGVSEKCPAKAK